MKFWTMTAALLLTLTSLSADASRLGAGRSVGKQSGNVTQREAAPAAPAATRWPAARSQYQHRRRSPTSTSC